MNVKRMLAILLSLILVLCMIPAAVFAEAPEEPGEAPEPQEEEVTEFTIVGWYAYDSFDAVVSVKINGEEVPQDGWSITAAPGSTISVEITLKDGFEIYEYEEGPLYWEGENYWYEAGLSVTEAVLPGEDVLAEDPELWLCFDVDLITNAISSVTITAPAIVEGEGYTLTEVDDDGYVYSEMRPSPEVTVPAGAPYEVAYAGWAEPSDDPDSMYGLGFDDAMTEVVFEKDTDYYFYVVLYATDINELYDMEPRSAVRAFGPEGLRLFAVDYPPAITINNGELIGYYIMYESPKAGTRAVDGPMSPAMLVLAKTSITEEPELLPPTSDMNPTPWVWTMVLALGLVFTALYYELEDIRRFNQGR